MVSKDAPDGPGEPGREEMSGLSYCPRVGGYLKLSRTPTFTILPIFNSLIMSAPTSFKLNTGASIPAIGLGKFGCLAHSASPANLPPLGTWQAKAGEVRQAVAHALKAGYRHIDGALCYQVSI